MYVQYTQAGSRSALNIFSPTAKVFSVWAQQLSHLYSHKYVYVYK